MYIKVVLSCTTYGQIGSLHFYKSDGSRYYWNRYNVVYNEFLQRIGTGNAGLDLWDSLDQASSTSTPYGSVAGKYTYTVIINLPECVSFNDLDRVRLMTGFNTSYSFTSCTLFYSYDNVSYTAFKTLGNGTSTANCEYDYIRTCRELINNTDFTYEGKAPLNNPQLIPALFDNQTGVYIGTGWGWTGGNPYFIYHLNQTSNVRFIRWYTRSGGSYFAKVCNVYSLEGGNWVLLYTVTAPNITTVFSYYDFQINRMCSDIKIEVVSGYSASSLICLSEQEVWAWDIIYVSGISLDKNVDRLKIGQLHNLVDTISPYNATNKTVTWSSNDPSIATVDSDGNVTGVSLGITSITVTTTDGGFSSTCQVYVYEDGLSDFESNAVIRRTDPLDLESVSMLYKYFDIIASGKIPNGLMLKSHALLGNLNFLDIDYNIEAMEDKLDIDSRAFIPWSKDLESNAIRRKSIESDLTSKVQIHNFLDVLSTTKIPIPFDVLGQAYVTERTAMDILFELVQAPTNKTNCPVVQDSYIRQARPTLNYGTAQSLLVGSMVEGEYQFMLQTSLLPYINLGSNAFVYSVYLYLYLTSNIDSNIIIDAYESVGWNESTVTWSNYSQTFDTPVFSFNCTSNEVKIDIADYVNSKIALGQNAINLVFKVRDLSNNSMLYFESNNSINESHRPNITVLWQDLTWTGYTANMDLLSNAIFRKSNARDLYSTELTRQHDNLDLTSKSTIRRSYNTFVSSIAKFRRSNIIEIDGNANMLPGFSLSSSSVIRQNKNINLQGNALIVYSEDMDSSAELRSLFSWLASKAKIQLTRPLDIDSSANIRNFIDVASKSVTRVIGNLDKDSLARVRVKGFKDLDSTIRIMNNTNLDSKATVERGNILDLPSRYNSYTHSQIDSFAELNPILSFELTSSVRIRLPNSLDLESDVDVHWTKDLQSISIINRTKTLDLDSETEVHWVKDFDSLARIKVWTDKNLDSKAIIKVLAFYDIESTAIIRQFDISEITSIAMFYGLNTLTLNGYAVIMRNGRSYLDSYAEIHTNARQWIPNVHGNDIFTFTDRKLPRVWKKENFIP